MKIAAITRYKHGGLYKAITELGWSQLELSRRTGIRPSTISEIINLRRRPNENEATAIQIAFGNAGLYLDVLAEWPDSFLGFSRGPVSIQTRDVSIEQLMQQGGDIALPEPKQSIEDVELRMAIEKVLNSLPERKRSVIRARFLEGKSVREIALEQGRSRALIDATIRATLRNLRWSSRIRHIVNLGVRCPSYMAPKEGEGPEDLTPSGIARS